jgi:hypothetical protein
VKFELVVELPKFDTGQYDGCEFSMSGGDARLAICFSDGRGRSNVLPLLRDAPPTETSVVECGYQF